MMLGHALDHQAWSDASGIVRALDAYWDTRGLGEEAALWADRILAATAGPGHDLIATAASLWLYTVSHQGIRQLAAGHPDKAAQTYREMLAWLQDQPATEWTRANISVIYHQLGIIAHEQGRLEEADDWYRQAIQIREELGLRALMATDYHELGNSARVRGLLDEAEDWYRKSLAIEEELGDRKSVV